MSTPIRAVGVNRTEHAKVLELHFNRRPTDDEMRTAHIMLHDLAGELPRLDEVHADRKGIDISIGGARRAMNVLASSLAKTFEADRGVNYVEYGVKSGGHDFVLTLQKRCMRTPHELREKAESERDEALEILKLAREVMLHGLIAPEEALERTDALLAKVEGGR